MAERPEIVRWTGPREALRPDQVTAAPVLDDGELLDRLLVIVGDARARLDELHDPAVQEVSRWLRVQVGDLLVARATARPEPTSWIDAAHAEYTRLQVVITDEMATDLGWSRRWPYSQQEPPPDRGQWRPFDRHQPPH